MKQMEVDKTVKSSQEQAVASWINYLNQVRLDCLMESLRREDINYGDAMETINKTLETISKDIVNNGGGRGGQTGMHGFIAEIAECGIGNARQQIEGNLPIYEWINDNTAADLRRGSTLIQQKFSQAGNHLSLQAVREHLEFYPNFIKKGGKYQIPSDHYEKIKWLLSISKNEADKMPTSTGDFSRAQWEEVHQFFASEDITFDSLEPSILSYDSVQRDSYEHTLKRERDSLKERNRERRNEAYQASKPSLKEGAKATSVAAVMEGGMMLCLGINKKRKEGKQLKDFGEDDWKEIATDSGFRFVKGGIRGASIYMLTNYTATPAAVASAIVTASFGVAEQAYLLRKGELDELAFIENSEVLCLDATVSAISSFAGQALIPIPVLGTVIGNVAGMMMYQIAKDNLSRKEEEIIKGYLESIRQLDEDLQLKYRCYVDGVAEGMRLYMNILDKAFAPDIRVAFNGSIELAKYMGVPTEEILDSESKIYTYFVD